MKAKSKTSGNALEQFEEWYAERVTMGDLKNDNAPLSIDNIPLSMQWGVYQDWSDSLGYDMCVINQAILFEAGISNKRGDVLYNRYFKTRNEARSAAITALFKLIDDEVE